MRSQSTREFTKVVIRQLPPTLQEADCKAAFDKEFADRYNWFNFARGKIGQKTTRQSTAYLNFKSPADVLSFSAAFDGATFADARGKPQPCSVEYAPFQRVPRGRVKRDPHAAYRAFLEELERQPEALPTAEQQLDQKLEAGDADGDSRVVTPLMAFFQEKDAPKERDRRALPVRGKPGARGRGLVGSALASISEAAADASTTRTQGKAPAKAASKAAAAEPRNSSATDGAAAADSAQAAREAARRALGALGLGAEAGAGRYTAAAGSKPGRTTAAAEKKGGRSATGAEAKVGRAAAGAAETGRSQTLTDGGSSMGQSALPGDTEVQPRHKKARDKPAKEPKVRPGFDTFVARGARQQDAASSGGGSIAGSAPAATDVPTSSGGSSAASTAKAAAAAAQAATQRTTHVSAQPQQPRRARRGSEKGETPSAGSHVAGPAAQAPSSRDAGCQTAEVPPAAAAPGSIRRSRGRGNARARAVSPTSAEAAPLADVPPVGATSEPAAGGAARKPGWRRHRPKMADAS